MFNFYIQSVNAFLNIVYSEFEVRMNLEIKRALLLLFSFCCSLSDKSDVIAAELSGSVSTDTVEPLLWKWTELAVIYR